MIDGKEIRIGNKVLYNGKIVSVTKTHFSTHLKNGVFSAFNPVVLTHDILTKNLGCEHFSDAGIYKLNGYRLVKTGEPNITFVLEPEFWSVEMTSLHLFMNTIYWLTGKEVVYKVV